MPLDRRQFLLSAGAACLLRPASAGIINSELARPRAAEGLQFGDLGGGRVIVWSRADRPARLWVEYATDERFRRSVKLRGAPALDVTDYTVRQQLVGLPPGATIFVRAWFESLDNSGALSEPLTGRVQTPAPAHDLRFVWGGDTAGQGFGINEAFGGMKIYETMRRREPHFFVHSGDTIYADGPIEETMTISEPPGQWTNVVTPEVSKVAETLAEFRGRYRYNLLDTNVRRFNAEVPQIWQWDDHEVVNNWSPSKSLRDDDRYREKSVPLLVARATRAFHEYAPISPPGMDDSERIFRRFSYPPLLDLFVIDLRSYRGPNNETLQSKEHLDATLLGLPQLVWLKHALRHSKAVWKVIACDMPLGLNVRDNLEGTPVRFEGVANANDGAPRGRELEIASLLRYLQKNRIKNVVWLTADVHYCAAHYYDPVKATFAEFDPFWEFVAGPLNAGTFGPNTVDRTFGLTEVFVKAPPAGQMNLSPYAGLQFFGEVNIDRATRQLRVDLRDIDGKAVYTKSLDPT